MSVIRRNLPSFSLRYAARRTQQLQSLDKDFATTKALAVTCQPVCRGWRRSRSGEDAQEEPDVEAGLDSSARTSRASGSNDEEPQSRTRDADSSGEPS